VGHIVSRALAAYFDVAHHTMYQVSTATVRIGGLREHGNLGLGTLEDLDGEIVIVDGHFFQIGRHGSVRDAATIEELATRLEGKKLPANSALLAEIVQDRALFAQPP
jgi:hypothetical protein